MLDVRDKVAKFGLDKQKTNGFGLIDHSKRRHKGITYEISTNASALNVRNRRT